MNSIQATLVNIEEMGSPFLEESEDLLVLDTRYIMNVTVWATVRNVEVLGEEQYLRFVKERLVESAKPITEPLYKKGYHCSVDHKGQVASLHSFSSLYNLVKPETDISIIFSHMRIISLSMGGKLRLNTKADSLHPSKRDSTTML